MAVLKILLCTMVFCLVASSLYADIYEWTDKDGVTHYTNYAPPPEARIIMKTEELPYDEAADRARLEAEREEQLELTRLELADREAELERREAQTEQRLAEAGRQAKETLREAEKILNEAGNDRYEYGNYGYADYYGSYFPYHYKKRYYYRNETGSIYFIKPGHKDHFKRYRNKKHHVGYGTAHRRDRYDDRKHPYTAAHRRDSGLRLHNRYHRSQLSIRAHSSSPLGRGHSGRGHPVSRSQRN
jgi:hypothetical protein